jgi:Tfp pilus assembly protein PilF
MYADRGIKLGQAEAMILKALMAVPDAISVQDSLGWVLYTQGRVNEAAARFDQILSQPDDVTDPVIHLHAGDAFWRLGWHDRARRLWSDAARLADKPPASRDRQQTAAEARARLDAIKADKDPPVATLAHPAPAAEPTTNPTPQNN